MNLYRSIPSNTTFLFKCERKMSKEFDTKHTLIKTIHVITVLRLQGSPSNETLQICFAEAKNRCFQLSQNRSLGDLVSESVTEFTFDFFVFREHCRAAIDPCDFSGRQIRRRQGTTNKHTKAKTKATTCTLHTHKDKDIYKDIENC